MLAAMRYKSFTWPNNPSDYSITYERQTALHKVPMGAYIIEDMGRTCRVMRGTGVFYGKGAYDTFKKLATVFYQNGPGVLYHPIWMTTNAYFTELKLLQEPMEDYVVYSFAFQEGFSGYGGMVKLAAAKTPTGTAAKAPAVTAQYHTVVRGDSLWAIGNRYGLTVAQLLKLNPGISNPNLIYAGQKVRVR